MVPSGQLLPEEIERRSFAIITEELGPTGLSPREELVLKRVIHTTADFDYAENLTFTPDAVERGIAALSRGVSIITDTNMALAGVSKPALEQLGGEVACYMADPDVAAAAKAGATTRAVAAMDKAASLGGERIVAVGNAPTALLRLRELIDAGTFRPVLVIAVPVGFVNVVESKELILQCGVPCIVARGRKGGSNVAAAICNALIYQATGRPIPGSGKPAPGAEA